MKTLRRIIVSGVTLLLGVAFWLSPIVVYADSNPKITLSQVPDTDADRITDMCADINDTLHLNNLFPESDFISSEKKSDSVTIVVDMNSYRRLEQLKRQDVMQITLLGIYDSKVSRSNRNKIYNEVCALDETTSSLVRQLSEDVQADFVGAYSKFRPFTGTIGIIFGVLTLTMFLLLGLTIVWDIAYINLPAFQLLLTKNSDEKPKGVSVEAWSAVKESDSKSGVEYVSPTGLYLKYKGKQLVVVALCILYLASGQIYDMIARVMDYFRGLL